MTCACLCRDAKVTESTQSVLAGSVSRIYCHLSHQAEWKLGDDESAACLCRDTKVTESSESVLAGTKRPPFRLYCNAVVPHGANLRIRPAVSEEFVVRCPAADAPSSSACRTRSVPLDFISQ